MLGVQAPFFGVTTLNGKKNYGVHLPYFPDWAQMECTVDDGSVSTLPQTQSSQVQVPVNWRPKAWRPKDSFLFYSHETTHYVWLLIKKYFLTFEIVHVAKKQPAPLFTPDASAKRISPLDTVPVSTVSI